MATLIMTLSAIFLIGLGAVLNFAPAEIAGRLGFTGMPMAAVLLQVLAGGLLGLGVLDWMSRRSVEGIYGRPIGLGNMLFFVVSAFGLMRGAADGVLPSVTWSLGAVTGVLALGFGWLVFVGSSPRPRTAC